MSADPCENTQPAEPPERLDELIWQVLQALKLPDDVVQEVVNATRPPVPVLPLAVSNANVSLTSDADEDFYPIELNSSADCGLFLIKGFNSSGKTTSLLSASILLGLDWNDAALQAFVGSEEKYIGTGQRFQEEFEAGTRSGVLAITTQNGEIAISIDKAKALIKLPTASDVAIDIAEEGWRPFRDAIKPFVQTEFIPQQRNYLRQVYVEVTAELIYRLRAVEQYFRDRSKGIALGGMLRELRALEEHVEELNSTLLVEQEKYSSRSNRVSILERIAKSEADEPGHFDQLVRLSKLEFLRTEVAEVSEGIGEREAELRTREEGFERRKSQFERAEPALGAARAALESAASKVASDPLKEQMLTVSGSNRIRSWLTFSESCASSSPGIYRRLRDATDGEDPATPTFKFRDELFNIDVETVADLKRLFGEYLQWARDFRQLLNDPLEQFQKAVEECDLVFADDLEELADQLETLEQSLAHEREDVNDERARIDTALTELRQLLGIDDADEDAVLDKAANETLGLRPLYSGWLVDGRPIDEVVEELGLAPISFWASGGATAALIDAKTSRDQQEGEVKRLAGEVNRASASLKKLRKKYDDAAQHRYARGLSVLEYAASFIENYLTAKQEQQKVQADELEHWQQTDMGIEDVDIRTPLVSGLEGLVRERCGNYYVRNDDKWQARPIQAVDLDRAVGVPGSV